MKIIDYNKIKEMSKKLGLEFEYHSLNKRLSRDNSFDICKDLIYFYPLNDGMPTCGFSFYKRRNLVINNDRNYSQISNLDDVLLTMVRTYDKALDEGIILNPYGFMLKLTDGACNNYHGKADLVVTDLAIMNERIDEDNYDRENRYYINLFLDHFMGWNFGVSINRNDTLREELEELNERVIDMGLRKYSGPGWEVYGLESEAINGLQHYRLPVSKQKGKQKSIGVSQ